MFQNSQFLETRTNLVGIQSMHALNIDGSGFNKKENNDLYLYNPE